MGRTSQKDGAARGRGLELIWPGKEPLHLDAVVAGSDDLKLLERIGPKDATTPGQLVFGDNLVAMRALEERHGGTLDLIYIDPPYATGLSYYKQTDLGGKTAAIEHRAYRDTRTRGMAGYLDQMYLRLAQMHRLLSDDGKLFVHCDWRANSMLRLLLDEIFGPDCFRNEIIWRRAPNLGRQAASKQLGRVIDSIFVYSKTAGSEFGGEVPKRRTAVPLDGKGKPKGARWDPEVEAYFTTAPRGDYTDLSIAKLRKVNRVHESATGTIYIKYFLTKGDDGVWYKEQPVDTLWDDYEVRPLRHRPKAEDMGYDTQKPEGLLERIIGWATKPGDLVGDFFCGSGTTLAVAQAMGRRWLGSDAGRAAIDVTRRRLLDHHPDCAFEIRSVARAERRLWVASLDGDDHDVRAVLDCFGAAPLEGRWGQRDGELVWVGPVDRAVTERDVAEVCAACAERGDDKLTLLGWEWAAHDAAALRTRMRNKHGCRITLRTIDGEVTRYAGGRKKPRFGENAEVDLELVVGDDAKHLSIRLTDVRCPDPPKLRGDAKAPPTRWDELVDSWMVDWSFGDGGFAPSWRSYRTRAARDLSLETPAHDFSGATSSSVQVRVLTVFGDQIVRTLRVEC